MAMVPNPQQALIWALNELEEKNFKLLKYHLQNKTPAKGHRQLTRGELEGLSQPDLASQLILIYGAQEAVKVVLEVLKEMHLMELVDQLNLVCLNGEYVAGRWEFGTVPESTSMISHVFSHSAFCVSLGVPSAQGSQVASNRGFSKCWLERADGRDLLIERLQHFTAITLHCLPAVARIREGGRCGEMAWRP